MEYILAHWYLWVIGIFVFPLIVVLPQLENIKKAIDDKGQNPEKIGKLFLSPGSVLISVIGGMGTFISIVLFFVAIILGIINHIKA